MVVSGIPTRSMTVPSKPMDLIYVVGEDFIHLFWGPPQDDGGSSITEYRIYKGVTSDSVSIFRTVGPETTDLNDTSVEAGTTYYYYVTCTNEKGESDNSSLITVTILDEGSDPSNVIFIVFLMIAIILVIGVILTTFFLVKKSRMEIQGESGSESKENPLEKDQIEKHLLE